MYCFGTLRRPFESQSIYIKKLLSSMLAYIIRLVKFCSGSWIRTSDQSLTRSLLSLIAWTISFPCSDVHRNLGTRGFARLSQTDELLFEKIVSTPSTSNAGSLARYCPQGVSPNSPRYSTKVSLGSCVSSQAIALPLSYPGI